MTICVADYTRYYASSMGRFMSPDWSAKEEPVPYAKLDNPQSLNLYSYVWNNPLSRSDPDGHEVDLTNRDAKLRGETENRILSNVNKNERGLFTTATDKNGKTSLVLNKEAAAGFNGKHSAGYKMLNQAINAKAVASVEINDHPTMPDGHTINPGAPSISQLHREMGGKPRTSALRVFLFPDLPPVPLSLHFADNYLPLSHTGEAMECVAGM